MSLAHYIHVNYPQYRVFPYLAKTLERGPKKMVVEDKTFVPFEMPDISGKQYCAIVCDNATLERMIGLEYYQNAAASIVIDHHASNEGYGDVNWTKVSEACAENVYHMLSPELLLNAAQKEAYPNAADYIYLGILHDTGGLARANQGIFRAVADLMSMGVDHGRIMKLFRVMQTLRDAMQAMVMAQCLPRLRTPRTTRKPNVEGFIIPATPPFPVPSGLRAGGGSWSPWAHPR